MPDLLELAGRHRRLALIVFGLAVVLYVALLCGSAATRKPWNDEAESADAGYNLGFKGYDGVPFFDERTYGLIGVSRHSYYIFPMQLCVLALWYHIFPFTLFSTRMLAMLWGIAMLVGVYHVLRKLLADPAIAFLGVVITAFNYQIMAASSFGRYDTMVAALGFGGYAVYLLMRERNLRWAILLANILVAASGMTHPNGIFYFTGLWFLIVYYDRKRIGWRDVAVAALPYLIGGAVWAMYIAQDYASFHAQITKNSAGRIGLLHPWHALVLEYQLRIIPVFGLGAHSAGHNSPIVRLKVLSLIALVSGFLICGLTPSIRRNPQFRPFFYLTGIHWFLLTFSENFKFAYYLIHALPLFCGVLAIAVAHLWTKQKAPRWAIAGAVAALLLVETGGILAKIRLDDYHNVYLPAAEFVKAHANPNDEIFSSCSFGFAYGFDRKIIDDFTLGYFSGKRPPYIVMEEIFDYQHSVLKPADRGTDADQYHHVREMLDSYKLVYHNSEYRVLERPDLAGTAASR
jgi:hypothetical protein